MKINALIPELYVSNFNKSLNYYNEILRFKIEYTRKNPNFAFLSYFKSQVMIQQNDGNLDWLSANPEYPNGRGINFQIQTNEIDDLLKRLKNNNYPIKRNLQESKYNAKNKIYYFKEFLILDPDGYLLRFSEEIS